MGDTRSIDYSSYEGFAEQRHAENPRSKWKLKAHCGGPPKDYVGRNEKESMAFKRVQMFLGKSRAI